MYIKQWNHIKIKTENEAHDLCAEEIHNIALSRNDDKRFQFDRTTSNPYCYKCYNNMQNGVARISNENNENKKKTDKTQHKSKYLYNLDHP